MNTFTMEGKKVDIYPSSVPDAPVIYLQTFAQEGSQVYRALKKMGCPDFNMVAVSKLDWNQDMTPWYCPPTSKHDTPCSGGADDYLKILTDKILPAAEKELLGTPAWRGLAGYSLAGLFAVYAIYQTDLFARIATMSGSLWFPDFKEYVFTHEMKRRPDAAYFSLGDQESQTDNPYFKTTQGYTDEIQKFFEEQGIDSAFILNPGNHYVHGDQRTAAGIDWILRR